MKNVKVILRQDLPNLGETGDLVTVKPGFARNYLLPSGLAFEATAANIRQLEGVSLTFHANAGEEGKLFGSITSGDIADRLAEQGLDFTIDGRWIMLDEPVKSLGVYSVPVRLHADVRPEIKVWVIKGE